MNLNKNGSKKDIIKILENAFELIYNDFDMPNLSGYTVVDWQ